MAQWQRVGFQIRRLGVRIPLASGTRMFCFCPARLAQGPERHAALTPVPVAQLDKASDYESEDWGFESLQGYFIFVVQRVGDAGADVALALPGCPRGLRGQT